MLIPVVFMVAYCTPSLKSQKQFIDDSLPTDNYAEFRFNNGSITLLTKGMENVPESLRGLHIGQIQIGDSINTVERDIGDPFDIQVDDKGRENRIYQLRTSYPDYPPYIVLTQVDGIIKAAQLTGFQTDEPYSFSSIKLGQSQRYVKKVLGPPTSIREMEEIGADLWSYKPYPFDLEIVKKVVFSIRVYDPDLYQTDETGIPSEFESVQTYLLQGDDYPEHFGETTYRTKIGKVLAEDLDMDGVKEVIILATPHYRQSPTIQFFQIRDGEVERLVEGLAPGPLVQVSGNYIDSHTLGQGIDFSIKVDSTALTNKELVKNAVSRFGVVVEYRHFYHADLRQGKGLYIDMTHIEDVPGGDNCGSFEFSEVDDIDIFYDDENYPRLAAVVGEVVYFYKIRVLTDGYLEKEVLEVNTAE
jgi:hypothetical protein